MNDAEELISKLGRTTHPEKQVTLDLSECHYIDVGAGSLIGNAIRPYGQASKLMVIVPSITNEKDFSGKWFLTFTRSGLGVAIAEYASTIISNEVDVTALVKNYYSLKANTSTNNLVFIRDIHLGSNVNVDNINDFLPVFYEWLGNVNVNSDTVNDINHDSIVQLCFEGLQNIFDHANKKPLPTGTPILSYFSLRYYKGIGDGEWPATFKNYLERLREMDIINNSSFIEIVVNDDGVGMAARQSLRHGIYWGSLEREKEALDNSLASGSVKTRTNDTTVRGDPGRGYNNIASSLRKLNAFASLRTGRILVTFNGCVKITMGTGWIETKAKHGLLHGYVPGTSLRIILPIIKPSIISQSRERPDNQGQMDLL